MRETSTLYSGGAPVAVQCAAPMQLQGDPDQLRRAFGNLIKNALEASKARRRAGRDRSARARGKARVWCATTARAFPRGSTARSSCGRWARPSRRDRALGLPIAQKIVHEHGGTLVLEPREGRGAQAVVELPLAESGSDVSRRILLVDDDRPCCAASAGSCATRASASDTAANGAEAHETIAAQGHAARGVILLDLRFPARRGSRCSRGCPGRCRRPWWCSRAARRPAKRRRR